MRLSLAMRFSSISPLLLFGGLTLPCLAQTSQPPGVEGIDDPNMSKRLIDYWADYGCFTLDDRSEPNVREQCKEACYPNGITSDVPAGMFVESSTSCWINGPESSFLTGKPLTEEELKENPRTMKTIKTGYCICNDPVINFLGDFFIKSVFEIGKSLEKLMCPLLMALDLVVEIGSAAIPGVGKAITVGMRTGIKTAKMYKHAYDAQDAAMEAGMFVDQGFGLASEAGCKMSFSFSKADLAKRFLDFADAPDELVPGLNYDELPCPKGKKASKNCKKKNGEDDDDPSSKNSDNNPPAQTSNQPAQSSKQPAQTSKKPVQTSIQQAQSSKQSARTSSQPSSTTADPGPTAKADCAAIGKIDMEDLIDENGIAERRTVGITFQSRRLEARAFKPKKGTACVGKRDTELVSRKYPSSGMKVMKDALAYGFNIIHDCSDYEWGIQKSHPSSEYDTEHVLEWSMAQNFFTTVNDHVDFKDGFLHPNPEQRMVHENPKDEKSKLLKNIVDFCTYWGESWDWPDNGITDPAKPAPAVGVQSLKRTPFQWFAEAYPYVDGAAAGAEKAHDDEFVLLQRKINGIAKNNMFSVVPSQAIYTDKEMEKLIEQTLSSRVKAVKKLRGPYDQPRLAIQRLRDVVGAYLYMNEKVVNDIFIAQVDRMGAQLEHLENALSRTPRTLVEKRKKADGKGTEDITITFDKWVPQKLKEKWFSYMDDVHKNANRKGQEFMKDNLKRLNNEFNDGKMIKQKDIDKEKDQKKKDDLIVQKKLREDMKIYIAKLEAKWKETKEWPKPKWNAQVPVPGT